MSACSTVDPGLCPLCGHANLCAMEKPTGTNADPCWCTRVHFSTELLQQLPEAARGKACICQVCAHAAATPALTIAPRA